MKWTYTTISFFVLLHACILLRAQQDPGMTNSNYAGIRSSFLNPSSIVFSKIQSDLNIVSGGIVFDNDFVYIPRSNVPVLGFKRIFNGAIHANLFYSRFDPQNPNKLYNVTYSSDILGPSFQMIVAKKHVIGFTLAARMYANMRDVPGNLAQNAFSFLREKDLWNTPFTVGGMTQNLANWFEYGFHYGTEVYRWDNNELSGGATLKYLQGISAAYIQKADFTYNIHDTTNISFSNANIQYGRTDYTSFGRIGDYGDLNHGYGFGFDIGFELLHREPENVNNGSGHYVYKLGLSMLDIGKINYDRSSASYHLQADNANYQDWFHDTIRNNPQLDKALSAAFYGGDSTKSLTASHFYMNLPTAISIQGDWNVYKDYFLNLTIVKSTRSRSKPGAIRPDMYSLTPRWETKWYEVSLPLSLIYYGRLQPRIGLAFRVYYFFFGLESPWGILGLKDFERTEFYAGIHLFKPK